MQRQLSRAALRSLNSSGAANFRNRANAADTARSAHASPYSHDFDHSGSPARLASRYAQLRIVTALRSDKRELASEWLLNLGHANGLLSAEDFSYILEHCAEAPDPLFVMETWKVMEENAVGLNKRSCRFIIRALGDGGYLKEALEWLSCLVENDHVHGSLPIFNVFLRVCGNGKDQNAAEYCLEKMETHLVGKSEVTYWELLKLAVVQSNLSAIYEIWKDCTRYYSPSIILLRKFIWSFSSLGDLEAAHNLLQHTITLASESSALVVSARHRYRSPRLDIPIPVVKGKSNNEENFDLFPSSKDNNKEFISASPLPMSNAPTILFCSALQTGLGNEVDRASKTGEFDIQRMTRGLEKASIHVRNFLRWSFNDMVHACARFNNYQLAERLFQQMHDIGLRPSRHTYDGFVKAVIAGRGVMHGMKVVEFMEKKNIEPYNNTLAALSVGHSKNLELSLAEAFLDRISDGLPKYIHSYNALLGSCNVVNEPERAIRILAKIKHLDIKLNIRTYELMFSLFGNVNVPYEKGNMLSHADVSRRIWTIEMDMSKNEIRHSFTSLKNLIRALGAEGMIEDMLKYLNVAESMLWHIDQYQKSDLYNIVLHALVKAKETYKAIRIFQSIRSCYLPANVAIYNLMIECCSMLSCFKSACALVSLMYRDGFTPQTLTYTALIKVLIANEDFERALHLLEFSKSEGIQPDIQLFNTVLKQAYAEGRIHVIEHIIERIHREQIQPNPSTVWYTFSAYVDCELHNTAMEALQVLSMRMISEDASILQERMASFEDLIYDEESDAELRIVESFRASWEFLATALLNLRWCAMMGSSISWLPEESPWARRLSSCYKPSVSSELS